MIFNISLAVQQQNGPPLLSFNYHYHLSTAIYSIICKSDLQFSRFFHDVGYGIERFKFFTFSDINIPFTPKGDRMLLLATSGTFRVCFHLPEAAEHFVKGIFSHQLITVRDEISYVNFHIREVEHCPYQLPSASNGIISVLVQPISPIVVIDHEKTLGQPPQYLSPYEKCFTERLIFSWILKYKVAFGCSLEQLDAIRLNTKVELQFLHDPVAERKTTIKYGTKQAQKIKGYTKFRLKLTAPKEMIYLALNSGLGVKNSLGMGCLQLIN